MKKTMRMISMLVLVAMLAAMLPVVSFAETQMVVTGDFVRLRDAYSHGNEIAQYNRGTKVTVLGGPYNGQWYKVKIGNRTGYMWGEYLKPASSSTATKPTSTTTKPTAATTKPTTGTTTGSLNGPVRRNNDTVRAMITRQVNVRSTASSGSKVVGTLKTRTTVSVLSRQGNSVYITTGKMSGYVGADYVTLTNTRARAATVKRVANGNYKLYTGSTGTGRTLATMKVGAKVTVLHTGSTWSYVKVGNTYGYVSRNVLSIDKA